MEVRESRGTTRGFVQSTKTSRCSSTITPTRKEGPVGSRAYSGPKRMKKRAPRIADCEVAARKHQGRAGGCALESVHPVFNQKARHLAEVLDVTGDQRGPLCQGDGRDEQIRPPDLLELFVLPQLVELARSGIVQGDDGERCQQFLAAVQELLSTH